MGPDCVGPITSMGHNLIGNTSGCNLTPGTGDLVNVDPLVGPLQNNGGATFTHALMLSSPAIDAGGDSDAPATDQRGVERPQGLSTDIGAFEAEEATTSQTPTPVPTATPVPPANVAPEPTPVPTATPLPTPTASLAPTPVPTTTPVHPASATPSPTPDANLAFDVTRDQLPGIVLTQTDIHAEFANLQPDPGGSGYQDNDAAAQGTIDPDDTALDLASQGRLDGYAANFFEFEALFGAEDAIIRPFQTTSQVDLFDSSESAQAFIKLRVQDFGRFSGREFEEGITLERFQEFVAPEVGEDTAAGLLTRFIADFGWEFTSTYIFWRRGPLQVDPIIRTAVRLK